MGSVTVRSKSAILEEHAIIVTRAPDETGNAHGGQYPRGPAKSR